MLPSTHHGTSTVTTKDGTRRCTVSARVCVQVRERRMFETKGIGIGANERERHEKKCVGSADLPPKTYWLAFFIFLCTVHT